MPNPVLILCVCFVVSAAVAVVSHRAVYRPLSRLNPSIYTMILASFSLGLILRYIIFLLVDRFDLFDKRIQVPLKIWYQGHGLILTNVFFWVVPTTIVLVVALSLLLNRTGLGREMRALADNLALAKVIGIPVERVHDLTWVLAGGLAGVAGALWGLYTWVNPLVGWLAILSVFAATVLGGMTSFWGTILGAYVVGFSENTVMQFLNHQFGLDFSFKPAIPFTIIILVLLVRPEGLTGFVESLSKERFEIRD
jgi:branched-subunit amino acid ABC-type transport system permease component